MKPSLSRRPRGGFTLIELLTVIAIVGILAAIVMGVIGKVRTSAKMTQSVSNLRQIGTATQLYAADNRGSLPVWHDYSAVFTDPATGTAITGAYWWEQLQAYTGADNQIYHSPAHEQFDDSSRDRMRETISYGWNYAVMGRHKGDSTRIGDHRLRANEFPHPSQTLVAAEGRDIASWGYIAVDAPPDDNRYGSAIPSLFLDGHVAKIDHDEFLSVNPWFHPVKAIPGTP